MSTPRSDSRKRATKIVATLGPATDGPGAIARLLRAGVDVFRLNMSHGSQEEHGRRIAEIRAATTEAAILADLQGPKIRLGRFEGGTAVLETGAAFTITTEEMTGNQERASTTYADFARDVKPGDTVLLADGAVELRVLSTDGVSVGCEVVSGGSIGDRKGINLPGVAVSSPSLTEKDRADLAFCTERGVDLIALSFVRSGDDLQELRAAVPDGTPIVAKIEKPEGWRNLESILDVADGIMVARGDLGVEMPLDELPYIQKSIIKAARRRGRFVITATQMLESMIENAAPTRAEVSDVANAIFDGSDAVMLSGETSIGKYPEAAVEMMARIALQAEAHREFGTWEDLHEKAHGCDPEIVAGAAYQCALAAGVRAIAVFTMSGSTARLISRLRPPVPVYAFTPSQEMARRLAVNHGVRPVVTPGLESTDEIFAQVNRVLKERNWARTGEAVVIVAGIPIGRPGSTNLLKVHRVA
ncbi:MAG TPA: pyruvate kinase [Bryobacteraceae bacterium]|nr:pyruvate kinase [Bryobacteraceae bacterium]